MPSRTLARRLLGAALLLPLLPLGPLVLPTPALAADGGRAVDYRGLHLTLPAGWRVVDLDRDPGACLRLDLPTLYLGHAGAQARCPGPRAVATRADTLHLEPLADAPPRADVPTLAVGGGAALPAAEGDSGEVRYALRGPGVMATLSYGAAPEAVRTLLAHAVDAVGEPPGRPQDAAEEAAADAADTVTALTATAAAPVPARAQGAFTGEGFDACTAPSRSAMDTWRAGSPFGAVGVYIGGRARACAQPQLTADWVRRQLAAGWHLMPIWVGPQPWNSSTTGLSTDPSEANDQGREAAEGAAGAARALGLPPGTPLYADLENYDDRDTWDAPVVAYVTAWTVRLHALGYHAAAYVSASSGAKALAAHYAQAPGAMPDVLWVARWNGAASVTDADMGLTPGAAQWPGPRRAHQYKGDHDATYGGVTINIDRSRVDVDPAALTPLPARATAPGTAREPATAKAPRPARKPAVARAPRPAGTRVS
ncbi:hypothetical protein GCM10010302_14350 [Streptomyces polychromogenes]|uniref:Rv2525c-like glycoside hydrolase-like domain-containing protein n=1 Tax=Streptomyces polychromogenes TaxID=67342 RepID=A0ABP3ETA2_9ACTN